MAYAWVCSQLNVFETRFFAVADPIKREDSHATEMQQVRCSSVVLS
jgi:hypothetical protein